MRCLIIAATAREIAPFLGELPRHPSFDADVLITGIGLPATVYRLGRQLHLYRPDIILQAGIGGCFDKQIPLSTVVVVKKDTVGDLGVVEGGEWKTVPDLGLVSANETPYQKGWLVNPSRELLRQTGLRQVTGITVNQVTTSRAMVGLLNNRFDPVMESMEGAGLHYVSLLEQLPFLQIRAVSNYVGQRDKRKWDFKNSLANLNRELLRLTAVFSSQ